MPIIHGSTSIKALQSNASSADEFCHVYHNNTWVFDERCIRFYSDSSFTIKLANSNGTASWNGTIYYTDYITGWTIYSANTEITSRLVTYGNGLSRYEISFRGSGNTSLATGSGAATSSTFIITGTDVYCEGDLLYLLDYNASASYSAANYTYARLFYNCTALKSLPKMSLATLPSYCYYNTYYFCTGLTEVPASKLVYTGFVSGSTYNCGYMFYYCTNLQSVSMPSTLTNFTNRSYYYMFSHTALLTAPAIMPNNTSVTLGTYCFAYMFSYCTSLVNATFTKVLAIGIQGTLGSGSTLGTYCFSSMFQSCSALAYAHNVNNAISYDIVKLAPTSLNSNCYRRMYYNCSSLKFASSTAITSEGRYSHAYRIPTSGAAGGTTSNATYQMLTGTGGSFTGTPTLRTTYYGFIPD